jgi:hypothetical protein
MNNSIEIQQKRLYSAYSLPRRHVQRDYHSLSYRLFPTNVSPPYGTALPQDMGLFNRPFEGDNSLLFVTADSILRSGINFELRGH